MTPLSDPTLSHFGASPDETFTGGGEPVATIPHVRPSTRNRQRVTESAAAFEVRSSDGTESGHETVEGTRHSVGPDARAAARRLAQNTSAAEREALHAAHRQLAIKKVSSGLTKSEGIRLRYLRWNIDRIEDADYGESVDRFVEFAEVVEGLADKVQHFSESAVRAAHGK